MKIDLNLEMKGIGDGEGWGKWGEGGGMEGGRGKSKEDFLKNAFFHLHETLQNNCSPAQTKPSLECSDIILCLL